MSYEFHEYANLFPLMDDDQLAGLIESVKQGFNPDRPIALFKGQILDGRNRYLACQKAAVIPLFKEFAGSDDDALQFVKRENLDRNHYNEAQRAMVGARLKSLFEEQAKKRQQAAGGDNKSIDVVRQKNDVSVPANLPPPSETDNGKSRESQPMLRLN